MHYVSYMDRKDGSKKEKSLGIKALMRKVMVAAAILVIVFSPYLLILDFKKYGPFVAALWVVSIIYYLLTLGRINIPIIKHGENENTGENGDGGGVGEVPGSEGEVNSEGDRE